MPQCDDDISLLAPGVDVGVCLDDALERIAPIDNRFELTCLGQFREEAHVIRALGGRFSDDFLVAGHRHPRYLNVGQPAQDKKQATAIFQ